jgi:hypothetical protein
MATALAEEAPRSNADDDVSQSGDDNEMMQGQSKSKDRAPDVGSDHDDGVDTLDASVTGSGDDMADDRED